MKMQASLLAIAFVLCAGPMMAQEYSVTGVSGSDTLNVRSGIDQVSTFSEAPVVGTIPADAENIKSTGLAINLNGASWREIQFGSTSGWVNERFLDLTAYPVAPTDLYCSGTEPFWAIEVQGDTGRMTDPELPYPMELSVLAQRDGLGRRNLWAYYLQTADKSSVLTGIVEYSNACSDGMSVFNYDFDIYLLGLRAGEGPAHGCCTTAVRTAP